MASWKELDRKIRAEKRESERREQKERHATRVKELERIALSAIEDIDLVILEFLNSAAVKGFPYRISRKKIGRDPFWWQWRTPIRDHVYVVKVHEGLEYAIRRNGDWVCSFAFSLGGEWGPEMTRVYGKESGEYFMDKKTGPAGPEAVDPLRRALVAVMNDLKIPLPD